jgi:N-terminal domain of toast_rack, DUF2154
MKQTIIVFMIAALAVVSLSCGLTVNIPVDRVTTGLTRTEDINIPAPDTDEINLILSFGAGEFKLDGGADDVLVSGTARYNVDEFKPEVTIEGNDVRLESGDLQIEGIPSISDDVENEWDLELGDQLMNLEINSGAYKGDFDLGGLSLKSLKISDGAADVRLKFSKPNRVEMESIRYQTGASNVRLTGLANANFTSMVFRSGAGNYSLDFSGELQRDADVDIESGISQVSIIVPEGYSAKVIFKGGFSNIETHGAWQKSGDNYLLDGSGPTLTITVEMGAGNLILRTTSD